MAIRLEDLKKLRRKYARGRLHCRKLPPQIPQERKNGATIVWNQAISYLDKLIKEEEKKIKQKQTEIDADCSRGFQRCRECWRFGCCDNTNPDNITIRRTGNDQRNHSTSRAD